MKTSFLSESTIRSPLHLSRYFPRYRYHESATDIGLLRDMKSVAERYLENVYIGNV